MPKTVITEGRTRELNADTSQTYMEDIIESVAMSGHTEIMGSGVETKILTEGIVESGIRELADTSIDHCLELTLIFKGV